MCGQRGRRSDGGALGWAECLFSHGTAGKLSRRDRQIYEEFNGTNQSDLARKWGVSLQWI
jgi:Mor family transcriptional regulator